MINQASLDTVRKSLVDSGSTQKYILYAIGEIFLVMIGILLALQVNNWNESRKSNILERELLTEVQNNIALNTDLIEKQIRVIKNLNSTSDRVVSLIEKKPKYDVVFEEDFYYCFYSGTSIYLSNDGFEAFKNAGFQIVKNNQLRKAIIDLFGVKNLKQTQFIEHIKENYKVYETFLIQNFYTEEQRLIPFDYERLMLDTQFMAIVKRMKERRTRILNNLNNNLVENQSVLELLKEELD